MMMENGLHRLASYTAWPQDLVCPLGLARLGLWYDGKDDRLKCYSCKAEFRTEDDPQTRHRERVPSCEHLRNTSSNIPLKFLDYCNSLSSDTTTKDRTNCRFTATDECGTVGTVHRSGNGDCEQKHEQLSHLAELYRTVCTRAQRYGLFQNVGDDTPSTDHGSCVGSDSSSSDRCNVNVGTTASASELQAMSGAPQILTKDSTTAIAFSPIPEIQQTSTAADPPKFPQYADNSTRVDSFRNGIVGQGQTAEGLSAAGWFYVGPNDKVRCFQCGGNLRDWEQGDDPWEEHRRWYNYCQFAKTHGPTARPRVPENSLLTIPSVIGSYRIEPREVKARMDTPTVRAILDMGYSRDKVKAVIETRLSTTGDDFQNAESLLEAIFQLEETASTASAEATSSALASESVNNSMFDNSSPPHVTASPNHSVTSSLSACDVIQPALTSMPAITSSSRNSPTVESSNSMTPEEDAMTRSKAKKKRYKKTKQAPAISASTENTAVEATQTAHNEETASEEQNLGELPDEESMKWLEENRQLREQRNCKVCMDAEVNTVFLPCGHLVCCATCSPHLRNCPICRTFIRGTVKTFLS